MDGNLLQWTVSSVAGAVLYDSFQQIGSGLAESPYSLELIILRQQRDFFQLGAVFRAVDPRLGPTDRAAVQHHSRR